MRNKRKVENILAQLSREEQEFAAHYGEKAMANREMFELARDVHHELKLNHKADPGRKLVGLFREAVQKEDFSQVVAFVDLLADWTCEADEAVEGIPGFGYWIEGGKDPVSKVLMEFSQKLVRVSDKPFDFEWVQLNRLEKTANEVMARLKIRAPGFQCNIKTLRNRAKELGLEFAPDRRGLRKGQKRNHIHRARR
jgi:hypothetical protein